MIFARLLKTLDSFWFAPVSPSPVCALRILYGILSFINGLLYAPDFLTWFGPRGVLPIETVGLLGPRPSLMLYFNLTDDQTLIFLWLFLAFSILVIVGFWTRVSIFLLWILTLSINFRNPFMFHQVDSVLRIVGFGLLLSPAGAMYSIDRWLRQRRGNCAAPLLYAPWAQRLIQIQVSCIYWKAFWAKLLGEPWRQGTAVYFAVHSTTRHQIPGFLDNMLFYKIATYYTLIVESCMWSLVWIQPLTKWILLSATILHAGIDWCINLDLLEWGVISTYVVFLKPSDIENFMNFIGKKLAILIAHLRRHHN